MSGGRRSCAFPAPAQAGDTASALGALLEGEMGARARCGVARERPQNSQPLGGAGLPVAAALIDQRLLGIP